MAPDSYIQLRADVEEQSIRSLKRFLDYGKRVRQSTGLDELAQWVARILHDPDEVYADTERAQAFLVGACEWLAHRWQVDAPDEGGIVSVLGVVDRVRLLRLLIIESDPSRRWGLQRALEQQDPKLAAWIQERALRLGEGDPARSQEEPFLHFVESLEPLDPLSAQSDDGLAQELEAVRQQQIRTGRELSVATERADRAIVRLEALEEETKGLRRSLREERENGDKLREERSRRIKNEREAREAATQLQRLKEEYVKLDARLRESVRRQGNQPLLEQLRQMAPDDMLGVGAGADEEEIGQARRRFASVFHSDRAAQLPPWVADLFDHLLGLVNAACDRARK
ncbi:MAG: hypothetical protein HN712_24115 [Gemmatimonadetes bacterium]|jgi:hypothetical protein|nr:hypothetical protein [Gemmatimonadota bacterium]MBT6146778.1 hypothetical protein [Gemmatimonadota bacterium]MBT7863424.1 hypothetical protein [Gemmatimonadota bacterium]